MSAQPETKATAEGPVVRVGLLGASRIAKQVWGAVHATGHQVTFVGCRDEGRGRAYCEELTAKLGIAAEDAPDVGSYAACVSSERVDLVYISIPVTLRDYWVMQCVEHNKHVVGEKPAAVDANTLRTWIEALDAKQLLYMDGTFLSHGARVKKVAEAVKAMGPVKHIFSNFSFCAPDEFMERDIRLDPTLEPHGVLGDLGWYNIRYILHVMDFAMPTEVTGHIIRENDRGAIVEFSGELTFRDSETSESAVASIFCSFRVAAEQTVHIATTTARLELTDFVHCAEGGPARWTRVRSVSTGTGAHRTRAREEVDFTTDEETRSQKLDMWRDIGQLLYREEGDGGRLRARPDEARRWAMLAWRTQAVMDKMMESARQSARV